MKAGGAGVAGYVLRNGDGDIDIDLRNTDIASTYQGVQALHGEIGQASTGDIGIRIQGGSITTTDDSSGFGVDAFHHGTGDIVIWLSGTEITAPGSTSEGIRALHYGSGDTEGFNGIRIDVLNSIFNTGGTGILAEANDPSSGSSHIVDANVAVHVRDSEITVTGENSKGVFGRVEGAGVLDIDLRNTGIQTSGMLGHGVQGYFENTGDGKLGIRIQGGSVTTTGDGALGVVADHAGTGDLEIHILGADVSTSGTYAQDARGDYYYPMAVYGWILNPASNGDIRIHVVGGSTVSTSGGPWAHGILAGRSEGSGAGDAVTHVLVQGSTVTTAGDGGYGITVRELSTPSSGENRHIRVDVLGSTVTTTGDGGRGIDTRRLNGAGDIVIDVAGSTVSTSGGEYSGAVPYGIYAAHGGTAGGIFITVRDGSRVTTEGDDAYGIFGFRDGVDGDIAIDVRGGTVATSGAGAHGVIGRHSGGGDVVIAVRDGSTVTTTGDGAHGVWAIGAGSAVHVLVRNAAVRASGAGSRGILVQGGGLDADGNRMQSVTVGSEVMGGSGGVGIWLVGGGRVVIGPDGRVGAGPGGVAIRMTRVDPDDSSESPRLLLELRLDPRSLDPQSLLGGGIDNPHGTTEYEVKVNGMLLFDSEDGATGVWTPIGAYDVRATGDDFASLAFARRLTPRAAVYEALPGVLLRLDAAGGPGGGETLLRSAGSPVYARVAAGQGSYEPGSATVGARYDYDRFSVESGVDGLPLDHELTGLTGLTGWAGVRVVSGSAKVSAATGGGRIEARGMGLVGGVAWEGEDGLYGRGRLSLTRYTADLTSETRGGLKNGASALVHALDLEGGRRFDLDLLGRKTRLTARGALRRSSVTMGEFEDGLFSRVSITDADRLAAGAGVDMETGLLPRDGVDRLALRGSLDVEQVLSGGTKVDVSETELESKAGGTRLGAGLGTAYRMGGYTVGGAVGANGLGSGDTSYSARLEARIAF